MAERRGKDRTKKSVETESRERTGMGGRGGVKKQRVATGKGVT